MAETRSLKVWDWIHTWSSLVCTVFMLMLCLTGLPLIFHHEIGHLLGQEIEAPPGVPDQPRASLDTVLAHARALYPERIVQFASQPEDDDRLWSVTLTPTPAPTQDYKSIAVDARTGRVVGEYPVGKGFMDLVLRLHTDLLAGLPGKLFLGAMGLLLLLAIVSGALLYAPFMRKLAFGDVRRDRSARTRWLDLHNLLGIVTLVWLFVVGATGVVNTLDEVVVKQWQSTQLAGLLRPYEGQPVVAEAARAPVQRTLEVARRHAPGMKVAFIAFPGTAFSSPHHNTFFMRGDEPLTAQLKQPVMVDAQSGAFTAAPPVPWTMATLMLSRPLHFGDYGGMPMKIIWALLDAATLIVLGSGLVLWFKRRSPRPAAGAAGRLAA